MAKIAICGDSGTGKSTSIVPLKYESPLININIKGLNPKTTLIFNPTNKELPLADAENIFPSFASQNKISEGLRYITNADSKKIVEFIKIIDEKLSYIKNVVIDDAQYIQAMYLMSKANDKGYDKFTETALTIYNIIEAIDTMKRRDVIFYIMFHLELNEEDKKQKIKTSGKMVDTVLGGLDPLFTTVLYTHCKKDFTTNKVVYGFETLNNGKNSCKSPIGMFDKAIIPNDLGYVEEKVRLFYKI